MRSQALVIMGASGAGKTTVGRLLAECLNWPFFPDFHPQENVKTMAQGTPPNDEDKKPSPRTFEAWLN